MLRLTVWRDELKCAHYIAIDDENKYVADFFTDEMLVSAANLNEAKQLFMDKLCTTWLRLYGERIKAIKEAENVEWVIVYDNVEVRDQQES